MLQFLRDAMHLDRVARMCSPIPFSELKKRCKILVIDDEEASFPTAALKNDGYTIDWWPRVDADGLARLEAGQFDLIILDIQDIAEPGLSDTGDGLGILRRLKETSPAQLVVAFSGKEFDLDAVPFWRLADDALRKPVTLIACKAKLDVWIFKSLDPMAQWRRIEERLRENNVGLLALRRVEGAIVRAAGSPQQINSIRFKKILGNLDDLDIIVSWGKRLAWLLPLLT